MTTEPQDNARPPFMKGSNMTTEIQQIAGAARDLAVEYPFAVYDSTEGCSYISGAVDNGPPGAEGCIVGLAAERVGMMALFNISLGKETIDDLLNAYVNNESDRITLRWLNDLQKLQDVNMPWGDALKTVDNLAAERCAEDGEVI